MGLHCANTFTLLLPVQYFCCKTAQLCDSWCSTADVVSIDAHREICSLWMWFNVSAEITFSPKGFLNNICMHFWLVWYSNICLFCEVLMSTVYLPDRRTSTWPKQVSSWTPLAPHSLWTLLWTSKCLCVWVVKDRFGSKNTELLCCLVVHCSNIIIQKKYIYREREIPPPLALIGAWGFLIGGIFLFIFLLKLCQCCINSQC